MSDMLQLVVRRVSRRPTQINADLAGANFLLKALILICAYLRKSAAYSSPDMLKHIGHYLRFALMNSITRRQASVEASAL